MQERFCSTAGCGSKLDPRNASGLCRKCIIRTIGHENRFDAARGAAARRIVKPAKIGDDGG